MPALRIMGGDPIKKSGRAKFVSHPFRIAAAAVLIITGLFIVAGPWLKSWYYNFKARQAIEQWLDETAAKFPAGAAATDSRPDPPVAADNLTEEEDTDFVYDTAYVTGNMEGILNIDAIDLHSPILNGDTKKNLDLGICRILHSVNAGENGNYVLAGHYSKVYGRHFNRLKEVPLGAKVIIQTAQTVYTYIAAEHFAVKADETWVLKDDFTKREITLITCDYAQKPIGRYIVRGRLLE